MQRDLPLSEQQCNIEFVKLVQKYPFLYNYELPAYSRKDLTDKAWEDVAEASNMTPSACRERWRNLRAVFMRTLKHTGNGTKKKPYYLADVMQFVVPFLRATRTSEADKQKMQNMEISQSENNRPKEIRPPSLDIELEDIKIESIDEDTVQEWPDNVNTSHQPPHITEDYYPGNKRPHTVLQAPATMALPETSDPVTSFVNSLMPELREMNTAQFKSFKRRVLVLIDDITTEIPSTPQNGTTYD